VGNFIEQFVIRKYRSFLVLNHVRMRYVLTTNILLFQYINVLLTGPTCKLKKKIIVHGLFFILASFCPFLCGLKSKSNEILLGVKGTAEIVKRKRREGNTVIQFNDGKDSQLILEF
jgi:hypothetical protein